MHDADKGEECRLRPRQPYMGTLVSKCNESRLKPIAKTNSYHISAVLKRKFSRCSITSCNKPSASGDGWPDPSRAQGLISRNEYRTGNGGQVDDPLPKRANNIAEQTQGTPNVEANRADVEHTACNTIDC